MPVTKLLNELGDRLLAETGDALLNELDTPDLDIAANLTGSGVLSATLGLYRIANARWLATAELFLDSGTERIATGKVTHPTKTYEGRVIEWGTIDRSIPTPAGLIQVSDAKIRVADTDRKWHNLLARQAAQRRTVIIRFMQEGTSERVADILFTGEVFNFEFDAEGGYLDIEIRDNTFSWLDQDFASVITQENFPEFSSVVTAHLPFIAGTVVSKSVPTGYTPPPPEPPPPGLLAAATARAEVIRNEIETVDFHEEWERLDINRHENVDGWVFVMVRRQDAILSDVFVEFQRESANGTLVLNELQDARDCLANTLASLHVRATEFRAFGSKFSKTIDSWIASMSAWAGTNGTLDWGFLLGAMDAEITRLTALENSPPVVIEPIVAPQGRIPLPHIGYIETPSGNYDRWGGAIHPLWNVKVLYRKLPTDPIFYPVPIEEYEVTLQDRQFVEYPGRTFQCTFIDFLAQQPEGTLIRMDADGFYYRPAWNGLPAVGYNPAEGLTAIGPLRNPVDLFAYVEGLGLLGTEGVEFDGTGFAALYDICANGTKSTSQMFCDGAQVEAVSRKTFLTQWVVSFQFDFLQTKHGKLSAKRIDDEDVNRLVIPQALQLRFRETKAAPTANRMQSSYSRDYATSKWLETFLGQNSADQLYLGKPQRDPETGEFLRDEDGAIIRTPQYEDGFHELWWVSDPITAANVTYSRMSYLAIGSYRQTIDLPLPEVLAIAELAKQIGITTTWGLQEGGYVNTELKTVGLAYNLDRFLLTLRTIHRTPVDIRAAGDKFGVIGDLSGLGGISALLEDISGAYCANDDFQSYTPGQFDVVAVPPWAVVGGSSSSVIVSGKVRVEDDANFIAAFLADCGSTALEQEAQMTFADFSSPSDDTNTRTVGFGPCVRLHQTAPGVFGDCYCFAVNYVKVNTFSTRKLRLFKYIANTPTELATVSIDGNPPTNGEVFMISVRRVGSDDRVKCWRGGTLIFDQTILAGAGLPGAGYPGFRKVEITGSGVSPFYQRWESFKGRNL